MTRASNPSRHHMLWPSTPLFWRGYPARDGGWTLDRTEAGRMAGRWVDVGEPARELNISTDAVRKRITSGSLHSKREDGSVRVWLDDGGTEAGREAQVDREALIEAKDHAIRILEDQLREEREARRRADTIIVQLTQANAALAQRVPELEASTPSDPQGGPKMVTEEPERVEARSSTGGRQEPSEVLGGLGSGTVRGSWWKRVFGG